VPDVSRRRIVPLDIRLEDETTTLSRNVRHLVCSEAMQYSRRTEISTPLLRKPEISRSIISCLTGHFVINSLDYILCADENRSKKEVLFVLQIFGSAGFNVLRICLKLYFLHSNCKKLH
jgi:hypothetical protein